MQSQVRDHENRAILFDLAQSIADLPDGAELVVDGDAGTVEVVA